MNACGEGEESPSPSVCYMKGLVMNTLMTVNLAILVCAALGVLFGIRYLLTRKNLYASMIVLGVSCLALGRLYQCARLWTGGLLTERFQPGILGIMGAFSFFFSSNYGQVDSLVDDGGERMKKYRRLGLIGAAYVIALTIPILVSPTQIGFKVGCALSAIMMACACYFHVKHLFIPDVDRGVVHCLRGYNALAVALSVLSLCELNALTYGWNAVLVISGAGECIAALLLVPMMDRGVKKWTT